MPATAGDPRPGPYRLAIGLVGGAAVTIWVGALVTTFGAGMTSPDWPRSGGLDLIGLDGRFWLLGTRDEFLDAAHRVLAVLTGAATIAMLATAWRRAQRRCMRILICVTFLTLLAVAGLGVTRVWYDSPWSAAGHAEGGVLLLSLLAMLAATSAPARRRSSTTARDTGGRGRVRLVGLAMCVMLVQVTLGTLVRHYPIAANPTTFRLLVFCHLAIAALLVVLVALVAWRCLMRRHAETGRLRWAAWSLAVAAALQIALGSGTWVMRFGWPTWLYDLPGVAGFMIVAEGRLATQLVTAHVTNAALILAATVWLLAEAVAEDGNEGT